MILFAARWVLPMCAPAVRDGVVAVEAGLVRWVGPLASPECPRGELRDLGEGVLLPGLINAHCHLELSHLAGEVPWGDGFVPWIEALVARRGADDAQIRSATADAIEASWTAGTVAVGDVSNALAHLDLLAASKLRAVVFLELLAWDPERAAATLAWGEERLRAAGEGLGRGLELRLAAHAPHSVSPELLRLLARQDGPAAIHLAESPDETSFLRDGSGAWPAFLARRGLGEIGFAPPGLSPVRHLEALGALHPRLVAVHGVQVGADDRARLARSGASLVLCPRSNRNLGVGTADVPALLAAGVRLALGTDSLASVDTLDVLDDAVLLHRQFPGLDPAAIVRMATTGGADALGLDDLGVLAPGRAAALAWSPAKGNIEDPHLHLLSGRARVMPVEAA